MRTKKVPIPTDSLINGYLPADYSDSFECSFTSSKEMTPDDIQIAFWTTWPRWVNWLFGLRAILVKPFGLKSRMDDYVENLKECLTSGKSCEYMSAPLKSDKETVTCTVDKHLTFYLSVIIRSGGGDRKSITAVTVVNFHNTLGCCYFFVIRPFHGVVVRAALKHLVKRIG